MAYTGVTTRPKPADEFVTERQFFICR